MRAWLWAILCVLLWAVAAQVERGPAPEPADAPANMFSGLRAQATLKTILGPERPHPAGTAEDAAIHARVRQRLAQLGVPATSFTRLSCSGTAALKCATVTDIVAQAVPGTGPAVLLMAHLDSVPA